MKLLPYTILAALCLGGVTTAAPAPAATRTHACPDMTTTPSREQPPALAAATANLQARQSQPANNQGSIPPYVPIVTAAPTQDAALASLGYYQTTYYECRTRDGAEHCGWHIPVQKIKSSGDRHRAGWGAVVVAAGVVGWMVV